MKSAAVIAAVVMAFGSASAFVAPMGARTVSGLRKTHLKAGEISAEEMSRIRDVVADPANEDRKELIARLDGVSFTDAELAREVDEEAENEAMLLEAMAKGAKPTGLFPELLKLKPPAPAEEAVPEEAEEAVPEEAEEAVPEEAEEAVPEEAEA